MKHHVPRHRNRRFLAVAGTVTSTAAAAGIALAAPVAAAPIAAAQADSYVALGDSYSSGVGTGTYLKDGTTCKRSVYAYPSLDAAALGLTLTFRACSGATVADVTNTQLSALSSSTGYVTISVGGNDAGFADVVSTCAGTNTTSCLNAVSTAQAFIRDTLPGRLDALYASIRSAAPNATFIVAGYPRLFDGRDCSIWTVFTGTEMSDLNQTADQLNGVISTAAASVGATFANPTAGFTGHALCDRSPWLNNVNIFSLSESFHPNKSGQQNGYAALTQPLFGNVSSASAGRSAAEVRRLAEASAGALTRDAARYAAADRTIQPEEFHLPALSHR